MDAWAFIVDEGLVGGFLALAFVGGLMVKRDGMPSDIGSHLFVKPVDDVYGADVKFLVKHHFSLVSWDKPAGEMRTSWNDSSVDGTNVLHTFYPRCTGFQNGSVVDDEGHLFPLDYWTPNGTADVYLPRAGKVQAKWLMEISEEDVWDCRDRYDELPPSIPQPTPKVLTNEQLLEIQQAKESKLLRECDPETWRQYLRGELAINKDEKIDSSSVQIKCERKAALTSYFSVLPADANTVTVSKYATNGAELLMQHMRAEDVTPSKQAHILHSAMSSILDTHHKQKRWTNRLARRGGAASADADAVMHAMIDAVVDASDVKDKKWMQMLAIGAVSKTVRESMHAGKAGEAEGKAMEALFGRFE